MTTPRFSRSALAAGVAALGAIGAIGVAQLAGGSTPVLQFAQAQSTSESATPSAPAQSGDAPAAAADANKETCADKTPLDAATGRGRGRGHGHRHEPHEPLDPATEAKVQDTALAAIPGATFVKAHKQHDGDGYGALLIKADGTRVLVREDANFKVTGVKDPAPERGHRRGAGHRGPRDGASATPTTVAS